MGVNQRGLVDVEKVLPALRKSGFDPDRMTMTATGELVEWNNHPALAIPQNETRFLLESEDRGTVEQIRRLLRHPHHHYH